MATTLEAGIVRVHGSQGQIVGAGFLVGPQEVVTCAHVVTRALGLADDERPPADAEVRLDFPLVAPGETLAARVEVWEAPQTDNTGDIAGLLLARTPPAGVKASRLVTADDLWYHRFRVFGFPAHHDQGVWVSGRLLGPQGAGWVQMEDPIATGYRVEPGFSGAPVWDDELDGVVGIAVAAEARPEVRAAYLTPADLLVRAWPGIADQARPPCPYRGLFAFRERDAALFFGREEASDQLLGELTRRGLVAVVGPSGSGKSSLVFAGVMPRLRQRQDWVVVAMRPAQAASPLAALAAALLPVLEPEMSETQRLRELASLEAVLGEGRLPQVVDRALARSGGGQLLLVIDQFEELYALEPEVVRQFVDVIVNAAVPEGRTRALTLVLTLRADFLGQALQHARLAKALRDSTLVIGQMTRDQLQRAITGPLRAGTTFEAGLVERILDDVGEEPGNLPLLEFALTLLWDRQEHGTLTHAGYEALGGVDGAIARYAEQVYLDELSAADREAARRLLVQLVEPVQAAAQIRRVARRTELDPIRWQLAQRLATARLLVAARDSTGMETVELVHEALIPGWARLREWVDADHAFRAWQERLRNNINAWQDSGRDTGALLRGVPLAEAERWRNQRPEDLGPAEQHYITASRAFQGRSLRRLRSLSAGLALLLVAALIFGVRAVQESQRAEQQSRKATSAALVSRAEALQETRPDLALLLSVAAFQLDGKSEPAANRLVRMASDRRDAQALLATNAVAVVALAFNPADGRMLVSAGADSIAFWDVARQVQVARKPAKGVNRFVFSPDGQLLATGGETNEVRLWDPVRHQALGDPLPGAPDALLGLSFSPDGRTLAGCSIREIVLWDLAARTRPQRISASEQGGFMSTCQAGFTSDGRHLIYPSRGNVVTWDIARRAIQRVVPVPVRPDAFPGGGGTAAPVGQTPAQGSEAEREPIVLSFTPSPDGNVALVETDKDDRPILWDLRRATPLATLPRDTPSEQAVFSQDGRMLAVATETGSQVIDVTRRIPVRNFTGHKSEVLSVALSADGRTLAAGGRDSAIALFQVDSLGALPTTASDVVFSADGGRLLTASFANGIQAWDVARRTRVGPSTAISGPLTALDSQFGYVAFSPDGRLLAAEGRDRKLVLWDVERRIRLGDPLDADNGFESNLVFSPDGQRLAWIDEDQGVTVWDVARRTRSAVPVDPGDVGNVSLGFSPDGSLLAIATDGPQGTIALWDVARRPPVTPWVTGKGYWVDPAFSPDGRLLAVRGPAVTEVLDVPGGSTVMTMPRQHRARFSPDSRHLAALVAGDPAEVAIWDVGTRTRVGTLDIREGRDGGQSGQPMLRFSPDSQILVTTGEDGVALRRFDPHWAARHLCQIVPRDLTGEEWNEYARGRDYQQACT